MNHFNNRECVNHLQSLRAFPQNAPGLQAAFNKKRMVRALKGRRVRPIFIAQQFDFTLAGASATPVSGKTPGKDRPGTPRFDEPVDILALCDDFHRVANAAKVVGINLTIDRDLSGSVLDQSSVYIASDAWSSNGPYKGAGYLAAPIPLAPGQRLFFDVWSNGVAAPLSRLLVAVGQKLLPENAPQVVLVGDELSAAQSAISKRIVPQTRVLSMRVNYPSAARDQTVTVALPSRDEPMLMRGFRSQGLIESVVSAMGVRNGYQMVSGSTPIWAIAACNIPLSIAKSDAPDWQMLETPYYVPANIDFEMTFISNSASTPAGKFDADSFGTVPTEYSAADVTNIQQQLTLEVLMESL